ncbi:MAG: hypothetical protein RSB34_07670 [Muribaculaceae bacterium]
MKKLAILVPYPTDCIFTLPNYQENEFQVANLPILPKSANAEAYLIE